MLRLHVKKHYLTEASFITEIIFLFLNDLDSVTINRLLKDRQPCSSELLQVFFKLEN